MNEEDRRAMDKRMEQETLRESGLDAAKVITDAVNKLGSTDRQFVIDGLKEGLCGCHRTLQQGSAGAIFQIVHAWAYMYDEGMYDARNKATCKMAKKMVDAVGEDFVLPFI